MAGKKKADAGGDPPKRPVGRPKRDDGRPTVSVRVYVDQADQLAHSARRRRLTFADAMEQICGGVIASTFAADLAEMQRELRQP